MQAPLSPGLSQWPPASSALPPAGLPSVPSAAPTSGVALPASGGLHGRPRLGRWRRRMAEPGDSPPLHPGQERTLPCLAWGCVGLGYRSWRCGISGTCCLAYRGETEAQGKREARDASATTPVSLAQVAVQLRALSTPGPPLLSRLLQPLPQGLQLFTQVQGPGAGWAEGAHSSANPDSHSSSHHHLPTVLSGEHTWTQVYMLGAVRAGALTHVPHRSPRPSQGPGTHRAHEASSSPASFSGSHTLHT